MAIKYIILPEKKQVIAILEHTRYDAYNKAMKILQKVMCGQSSICICPDSKKLTMPNEFKVTVNCMDVDEFDENVGKSIARKRLLKNYYKSFDKKIASFMRDLREIQKNIGDME